jgi:hypothetical protein
LFHSVIVAALPYLPFATAVLLLRATTASEDIKHIIISSSNIAQHLYNYYILIYPLCLQTIFLFSFPLMCSSWPLLLDGEWQTILEVSFLLFQTDWSKFEIKKEVASFLY